MPDRRPRRRLARMVAAVSTVAAVAVVAGLLSAGAGAVGSIGAPGGGRLGGGSRPLLAVIGSSPHYAAAERSAGVRAVTLSVGWNLAEPADDHFDLGYLRDVDAQIRAARAEGLAVVLDAGTQYPPRWVFGLGGGTRFVDQYGDAFAGTPASGNDVANDVTDPAVRAALGVYLAYLGRTVTLAGVVAVRAGAGPFGELRYPGATYGGHTDCYWAYDTSSQAASPALRYRPGTGSPAEAAAFLRRYDADLVDAGDWLDAAYHRDFHRPVLVLLPGWGQRPGVAAEEAASLLTLPRPEFDEGLDWGAQLASLPYPSQSIAYTTYLDAPSFGISPQAEDPLAFLATVAARLHLGIGGENTGTPTLSALRRTLERAGRFHLRIVSWFDASDLAAASRHRGPGPTFADLGAAARRYL